jgi:hypothetical protein
MLTFTAKHAGLALLPIAIFLGEVGLNQPNGVGGRDLVVINDLNAFDQAASQDPNNARFYRNLVRFNGVPARKRVVVHVGHGYNCPGGGTCVGGPTPPTFETMMTVGGAYTVIDGDDTSFPLTSIPNDVRVIILWLPSVNYSAAEVTALKQFVGAGGRVVVVGERGSVPANPGAFAAHRQTLNKLLADMGTTMQNVGGEYVCPAPPNVHVALPSSSIKPHQVTSGMKSITMSCASALKIGAKEKPLIVASDTLILAAVTRWPGGRGRGLP